MMCLSSGDKTKKAYLESMCKLQSLVAAFFSQFQVIEAVNIKYLKK